MMPGWKKTLDRFTTFTTEAGLGYSRLLAPLAGFAVSVPPEPARLVRAPDAEQAQPWSFVPLPGHAVALVVEGVATEVVACRAE